MNHSTVCTLRAAGLDDYAAILRLYGQLHPDDPVLGDDTATFGHILDAPGLHLLVAEQAGLVVATTYLNVIPNLTRGGRAYGVVENVVVEETLRGKGIGRQLMAFTLATAWAQGCYKVMLMTGSRDAATHAFYRACGFRAEEKTAYLARPSER